MAEPRPPLKVGQQDLCVGRGEKEGARALAGFFSLRGVESWGEPRSLRRRMCKKLEVQIQSTGGVRAGDADLADSWVKWWKRELGVGGPPRKRTNKMTLGAP